MRELDISTLQELLPSLQAEARAREAEVARLRASIDAGPREGSGNDSLGCGERRAAERLLTELQQQLERLRAWAASASAEVEAARRERRLGGDHPRQRWSLALRRAAYLRRWPSVALAWPSMIRLRRFVRSLPLPIGPTAAAKRILLRRVFGVVPRVPGAARPLRAGASSTPTARTGVADVLVWGDVDGHSSSQRLHFLLRELAGAGYRVFSITFQCDGAGDAGFDIQTIDDSERLFRIVIRGARSPAGALSSETGYSRLVADLAPVLEQIGSTRVVNLLLHPSWLPIAELIPNSRLVYDYTDRHLGPTEFGAHVVLEALALWRADHVVVNENWLADLVRAVNHRVIVVSSADGSRPQPVEELQAHLALLPMPLVTIIVVTYNNLELTRQCLESIEMHTLYGRFEVIVVDNGSSDGTPAFLSTWQAAPNRRAILNRDNRGFAAANNQALTAASGDYIVLLNNDTVVTAGWLGTLAAHLRRDPSIGLIGPVTNNIENAARIALSYDDLPSMHAAARRWTLVHMGQTFPMATIAFFCVMMRRSTWEGIGALDESFGIGMFEDDDYCRRVQAAGMRICCAKDVFVHHHFSASFDALDAASRWRLFEANRKIYERKWGRWQPHRESD